jgi:hypothetical protein
MADLPTGTVTFLFTEVEGSIKLWEQDATAMQAAHARRTRVAKTIPGRPFQAGGGSVEGGMG